jgi:hypothetical protein
MPTAHPRPGDNGDGDSNARQEAAIQAEKPPEAWTLLGVSKAAPAPAPQRQSVLEESQPFYLGTVRIPLSSFTSRWSVDIPNRTLSGTREANLRSNFRRYGVNRANPANHVLVGTTEEKWRRVKTKHLTLLATKILSKNKHIDNDTADRLAPEIFRRRDLVNPVLWQLIDDWEDLTGCKAELLAGQHRVVALRSYLKEIGEDPELSEVSRVTSHGGRVAYANIMLTKDTECVVGG